MNLSEKIESDLIEGDEVVISANGAYWGRANFSHYEEDKAFVFTNGTKWSSNGETFSVEFCKKPTGKEEILVPIKEENK